MLKLISFLCKECHVFGFHWAADMVYMEAQKNLSIPQGKAFFIWEGALQRMLCSLAKERSKLIYI